MPLSWNSYWYRFVSAACLVRGTELNIYKNWCACAQTLYRGSCHTLGSSSASWNTEASLRTFSFLSTQKFDRKGVQHLPIANYYFAMMSPALWQKPKRSPMPRLFSRHPTKAKPLTKQGQRFTFHGGAQVFSSPAVIRVCVNCHWKRRCHARVNRLERKTSDQCQSLFTGRRLNWFENRRGGNLDIVNMIVEGMAN